VLGGLEPYHFSISSGYLPDGLQLDGSGGIISGIPTAAETDTFTILCEDSTNPPLFDEQQYILTINPGAGGCPYIPGDINHQGVANGIDVTFGVSYLKGGIPPFACDMCPIAQPFFAAGDVNGTCSFNGIDITYFVGFLKGGPALTFCPSCPPSGMAIKQSQPAPPNR
jgi:hypothetical protein